MSGQTYTIYQTIHGLEAELLYELEMANIEIIEKKGDLLLTNSDYYPVHWAQNSWIKAQKIPITSISHAAKILKNTQRNWANKPIDWFRRSQLIQELLPYYPVRPIQFLETIPSAPIGAWTLWNPNELLFSPQTTSVFPNGELTFKEDHINPPSRAYLKLWELMTVHGICPTQGQSCIDVGSSPGGWTWVLQGLGLKVMSVDKAPLDPKIINLPNIEYRQESAFGLDLEKLPTLDWFFSDIICYPERLYQLVLKWLKYEKAKNFVCTIKFQGETDFKTIQLFEQIPGSKIIHLHHNKHELTWYLKR